MQRHGLCSGILGLLVCLCASISQAALQCTQVFPGGIQSHSPTGFIQMGYLSRVYGSGPTLNAPTVTHTHAWQDQVGLCDGVKCAATGQHAARSAPDFQTGSAVPTAFRTGTARDGGVSTGSREQVAKGAGDYGAVTVGQESTLRFTGTGGTYLLRGFSTQYRANIELAPGEYWIDGNLTTAEQTLIRPLAGSSGVVRLYVRGRFQVGQMRFEGFSAGQIELYVQGDVKAGEDFQFPGAIHATGKVELGTHARVAGGVHARDFARGNSAMVSYPGSQVGRQMGALRPDYNATFELGPGSYWIDGDLDLSVSSRIRKLPGEGTVRLFVRGDITLAYDATFEGFRSGELLMYATGDITLNSQKDIPAFVYAAGDVRINFSGGARYQGGITGRNVYIGQGSIVEYVDPVDLGDLCESTGGDVVDHFRLLFSTPQFSCEPIPVRILACADAACSSTVATNRTLVLSPSDRWLNGGTVNLANTATATAYLKRIPGTLTLSVSGERYRCDNSDCRLEIRDSGFEINVDKSHLIAGEAATFRLQALHLDNSGACVKDDSFAGTERPIEFWSGHFPPGSGGLPLWIRDTELGRSEHTATPISIRFDAEAKSAPLSVRYNDAGKVILQARFIGSGAEEGLEMRGSTPLVSRPAGFCIRAEGPGCSDVDCPLFAPNGAVVRAGDPFRLHITPVRTPVASCVATPGFADRLQLRAQVVRPDGFVEPLEDGTLAVTEYVHPSGVTGTYELAEQRLHEVGSFQIEVRSENYLGLTSFGSVSEAIGRFAPAYLQAEFNIPSLQAGCTAEGTAGFSYQGQPIGFAVTPELTLTGKSRNGTTTRNYDRGGYWKLNDELAPTLAFVTGQPGDAARLSLGRLQRQPDAVPDGSKVYRPDGALVYQRLAGGPRPEEKPFVPRLVLTLVGNELTDRDATCHGETTCVGLESAPFGFVNPASDIRLGRLRIGNAHGSELDALSLPVIAEHFDSQGYRQNPLDSCTRFDPADPEPFSAAEPGGVAAPVLSYEGRLDGGQYWLEAGSGAYRLSAPRVSGSQRVWFRNLPGWLQHDWNGDGVLDAADDPRGLATFGIYKGHERVIFRRELIGR